MVPDVDTAVALDRAGDALLVGRARQGDRRAFGLLLERHGGALRRSVSAFTRHRADTDDVLQETALKIWMNLASLDDPEKVRAWMTRIASREALRFVMARRQEDELSEELATVAGPDEHVEHLDARVRVHAALDVLPGRQRQCWLLRELGGHTYREIADRLGVPESTVRGSLAAARRTVSMLMGDLRAEGIASRPGAGLVPIARLGGADSPVGAEDGAAAGTERAVASTSREASPIRARSSAVRVRVDPFGVPVPFIPDRLPEPGLARTRRPGVRAEERR